MSKTDVTNLRELAEDLDEYGYFFPPGSADLCRRVADEIERVRTKLAGIVEEHARVWMKVHEQEREIEWLGAENAWLRNLVPPKMLATAVKKLNEELKAAEATGGEG